MSGQAKTLGKALPYLALLLPSSIALFIYGYLGRFTRFIADDFCSAYYAEELGFVRSIWYWYHTWSGRYSAFGMDWLVLTKLLGMYSINIVPPIILVVWIVFTSAAIYLSLKSFSPERNNLFPAILLAASLIYILLVLNPNVPQSLYWWNGVRSYTLPLVVLSFYTFVFLIISKQIQATKQLIFWGIMSFTFLFASGGLSETYVVMQLILLAFLAILKITSMPRKKTDPELFLLLAGLLGTILSLVVIISAPGNAIRQSRLDSSLNLTNLMLISLTGYGEFVLDLFNQANKFTGLIGVVLLTMWVGLQYKDAVKQPWKIFVYFVSGFALSFVCILPGVYGYSTMPPTRTLIIPVFVLIICFLQTSFLTGSWLSKKIYMSLWIKNGLMVLAGALMLVSTAITSQSLYESRFAYIEFAERWDAVDAQILRAKADGQDFVKIPSMENWARLDRPNQDPGFWVNECYTGIYGIEVYGPPFIWED